MFVPSETDVLFANWLDAQAFMNRSKGQPKPKPVDRPWLKKLPKKAKVLSASDIEARHRLKEKLGITI